LKILSAKDSVGANYWGIKYIFMALVFNCTTYKAIQNLDGGAYLWVSRLMTAQRLWRS